jgi:hypothetical protein
MPDSIALEVYNSAKTTFYPPHHWRPSDWRVDVMLACGLTALAVEATLLDVVTTPCTVLRDPNTLARHLENSTAGIMGFSYSGGATEVVDGLLFAKSQGKPIALASNNKALLPTIFLPDLHQPRSLQHILFTVAVPQLLGTESIVSDIHLNGELALFLEEVYKSNTIPIFISSEDPFRCKALLAYWLEYLHRPGFSVQFPDWTHDLLWAMTWQPKMKFAFIFDEPVVSLSDNRFTNVLRWAIDKQYPYVVLDSTAPSSRNNHVGYLLACVTTYYELALRLGVDISRELHFDSWKEHINDQ